MGKAKAKSKSAAPARVFPAYPAAPRSEYILTRWLFLRIMAFCFLVAFAGWYVQLDGLYATNKGLLPVENYLLRRGRALGDDKLWRMPTVMWFHEQFASSVDEALQRVVLAGVAMSALALVGVATAPVFFAIWALYLSLFHVGQRFAGFQWDTLLLETGFLCIFFAPVVAVRRYQASSRVSRVMLFMLRWCLFRFMFMSGVVKLNHTWTDLSALSYHYWTTCIPHAGSWAAYQLPDWFHQASVLATLVIELVCPFLVWAERRYRIASGWVQVLLMVLIMATGNYNWFNIHTIAFCVLLFDDEHLLWLCPSFVARRIHTKITTGKRAQGKWWHPHILVWAAVLLAVALFVFTSSLVPFSTLFNPKTVDMGEDVRRVHGSAAQFHITNGYGLFRHMTQQRGEIEIQGSNDGVEWLAYEFKYKPGDVHRAPRFVLPYHPRLDWQMWFAALNRMERMPWFVNLLQRLLEGSEPVLALMEHNPFPDAPPRFIRAEFYQYRFTTGLDADAWWERTYERSFSGGNLDLHNQSIATYLQQNGLAKLPEAA